MQRQEFLTRPLIFYRSYSRIIDGLRESWDQVCDRTLSGLKAIGNLTDEQAALIDRLQREYKTITSGRFLWVGGTKWLEDPQNVYGSYNCSNTIIDDIHAIALQMALSMTGCGVGAMLEEQFISKLPKVTTKINLSVTPMSVNWIRGRRLERTKVERLEDRYLITVGDSRQGWVTAYEQFMLFAVSGIVGHDDKVDIEVDLTYIRPKGETIEGFGGVANASKLPQLWERLAEILNGAIGRSLTAEEVCLLIDEGSVVVVAGNIRRCLPEDALVHTSKGLVPIKDIQVGDLVQTPLGFRKVIDKFDQGVQEIREIETNATFPRATENHRMAVLADAKGRFVWKKVGDLTDRDRLMHSTQILSGSVTSLPVDDTAQRPVNSRTAKNITIPELTSDVAWLVGYTHGNGYVSVGRNKHDKPFGTVSWSMNATQHDLIEDLKAKIDSALALFGVTAKHSVVSGENTAVSRCCSIRLAEYFLKHIKQPNTTIQIPCFILQGSVDIRSAYLAGLADSDGSIHNRPPHLVTTVYQPFVRQVGALLSSLGIAGRIVSNTPENPNWKTKYSLTIPAFKGQYNSLIAQYSAKGLIKDGQRTYGFTVPAKMMRAAYAVNEMSGMGLSSSLTSDSNYERYTNESGVDIDIPVSFKGLGSVDCVQTYDIEVEDAHCFYCDGFLTHNSAGIKQFDSSSKLLKTDLWSQDKNGNWVIDPKKDALRMSNHTRVYHKKPDRDSCIEAVRSQYFSGEGAIQWAGEAVARANADILDDRRRFKKEFLRLYNENIESAKAYLESDMVLDPEMTGKTQEDCDRELSDRMERYGLNPCGEILLKNNFCNLGEVHLNMLDPNNLEEQDEAFYAAGVSTAVLLHHKFPEARYQYSREVDPIVGVSFTGLFDFFVNRFGVDWLRWWEAGRPSEWGDTSKYEIGCEEWDFGCLSDYFLFKEQEYLQSWKESAFRGVYDYCDRNGIRRPNRCTTVQPSGSKSLLTNASPGWHPPKASRYIRRMTFARDHSIASAAIAYGYSVIPSQSDKDENGQLLDDPFDPRCTEWLVEVPIETSWANLEGAEQIDISKFSALAQFDFYMQIQKHYVSHNCSGTLEVRESEIELLGDRIYQAIQNDEGYVSCAILARYDDLQTFPRLPFEPIDKETYDRLVEAVLERRTVESFAEALQIIDNTQTDRAKKQELSESGPAGCDSDKCLFPNVVVSG